MLIQVYRPRDQGRRKARPCVSFLCGARQPAPPRPLSPCLPARAGPTVATLKPLALGTLHSVALGHQCNYPFPLRAP